MRSFSCDTTKTVTIDLAPRPATNAMTNFTAQFEHLVHRVRGGDRTAAEELVRQSSPSCAGGFARLTIGVVGSVWPERIVSPFFGGFLVKLMSAISISQTLDS